MKIISLFANAGIAESYLESIGFHVVLANEIDEKRASIYQQIYPNSKMICGDILDEKVFENLVQNAKELDVDILMATPPCQGMSPAGRREKYDKRNDLIIPTIEMISRLKPKYAMIENVPEQKKTTIFVGNQEQAIPDFISSTLRDDYVIRSAIINMRDYGVPQQRERMIYLLTRRDQSNRWGFPQKDKKVFTLRDAIGNVPDLDPICEDMPKDLYDKYFPNFQQKLEIAQKVSYWHRPTKHNFRQVFAMLHTPTGKSAFSNTKHEYKPLKPNGDVSQAFDNAYKRQLWDIPAYTITTTSGLISSNNNVHPGSFVGHDDDESEIYSNPRVLSIYELFKVMTIPDDWNLPKDTSDTMARTIIGEGVPPLFVKKLFEQIGNEQDVDIEHLLGY